ncbi:hypothetical protein GOODEAATRI_010270, partial [Goodea atripinnis]
LKQCGPLSSLFHLGPVTGAMSSQSSPASGIQGLLLRLHESLSDEDSRSAALKCHDTASLLFSKDYGLLSFLRKALALDEVLQTTKASSVAAEFKIGDIFEKFYSELCQRSKLADSVLGKIYELLGVLGEVHPSEMVNNSDKLYRVYLGELKEQVGFYRFQVPAINLFSSCLMDHYRDLFETMCKLCGHINGEMKKTSYSALEAFLKQVALLVADNIEEHKSKLKFFMQKFCGIIKTMDSTYKELSIAIRGYGFFAAVC